MDLFDQDLVDQRWSKLYYLQVCAEIQGSEAIPFTNFQDIISITNANKILTKNQRYNQALILGRSLANFAAEYSGEVYDKFLDDMMELLKKWKSDLGYVHEREQESIEYDLNSDEIPPTSRKSSENQYSPSVEISFENEPQPFVVESRDEVSKHESQQWSMEIETLDQVSNVENQECSLEMEAMDEVLNLVSSENKKLENQVLDQVSEDNWIFLDTFEPVPDGVIPDCNVDENCNKISLENIRIPPTFKPRGRPKGTKKINAIGLPKKKI